MNSEIVFVEDKTPQPEDTPEFIALVKSIAIKAKREERNKLLSNSDKYALLDYPITEEKLIIVKQYRQILLDFDFNNNLELDFPTLDI